MSAYLNEIDKIAKRESAGGGQYVSREGVQRDILPVVEGSAVTTVEGMADAGHLHPLQQAFLEDAAETGFAEGDFRPAVRGPDAVQ